MKKNQGFSLVELIVVVAIMAILVGVLAPAYLRYVEKSRKGTDISAIDEMMGAADKVAIDPQLTVPKNAEFHISFTNGTAALTVTGVTATTTDSTNEDVLAAWVALVKNGQGYVLKSSDFQSDCASASFVGTVGQEGEVRWTGSNCTAMTTFSTALASKLGS